MTSNLPINSPARLLTLALAASLSLAISRPALADPPSAAPPSGAPLLDPPPTAAPPSGMLPPEPSAAPPSKAPAPPQAVLRPSSAPIVAPPSKVPVPEAPPKAVLQPSSTPIFAPPATSEPTPSPPDPASPRRPRSVAALVVGIILGVGGGACLAASIGVFTGRRGSATDGLPLFFGGLTGAGIGLPFAIYGGTSVPASAARRGAPGEMGWAWRF